MREVKRLSPSGFMTFQQNLDQYVRRYLADMPEPRYPQTKPMAIGSSFDAFVKNELGRCLLPAEFVMPGGELHLKTLFESQVDDEEDQKWAWEEGGHLFLQYKDLGAFDDLLADFQGCHSTPVFESGTSTLVEMPDGVIVPLFGYPDCYYYKKEGILVILDWKCNNYTAKRVKSPSKFYLKERSIKDGKFFLRTHPKVTPVEQDGLVVDAEHCFSEIDKKWCLQMTMYGWMLGHAIGEPVVLQIEQILIEPNVENHPACKCVTYRGFASSEYQFQLADQLSAAWTAISSGHIYSNLTLEESEKRVETMSRLAAHKHEENPLTILINGALR